MSLATRTSSPERGAKTYLLTVLGELVAPDGREVWQENLVGALTSLDFSPAAARQVIARASQDGWLTSKRVGRRSLMTITDSAWGMLHDGRERTLSFGVPQQWDERWLVVALTVPETQRQIRYHLRTELAWLGYGSLGNGVWISPHTRYEAETMHLLSSNEGLADAYVFVSETPLRHTPRSIAREAWDLDALLARYTSFLERFEDARPKEPQQVFTSWIELFTSWRHFPLFDPELPDSLLPTSWPRSQSRALFVELESQWSEPAHAYFRGLVTESGGLSSL